MNQVINVLVFPCGSEPGTEIGLALQRSVHVKLFGASSVEDHGRFVFDNYIGGLPRIHDAAFEESLRELIATHRIDVVFATHDTVSLHLAGLAQKLGFYLVNGDAETARICRSKRRTYAALADAPWLPRMYDATVPAEEFPVIAKPDMGQGGVGVRLIRDAVELAQVPERDDCVVVEYLPGAEITVDCFTDWQRELVWVGPRTRDRVRAGITMRSEFLAPDDTIRAIAAAINARLVMRGPWFFQLKRDRQGEWKLLEVSCRIAGTMVAQRGRGVNLPLMAIQDYLQRKQTTLPLQDVRLVDRRIVTKAAFDYAFDTVVMDYDDTIVAPATGRAFPEVMAFLYRMIEAGKRIVLVTRHAGELAESLAAAHVSPSLFAEIVHLRAGERKSDYVGPRSIFVDNHFPERKEVADIHGCPVFDVDTLSLIHWG